MTGRRGLPARSDAPLGARSQSGPGTRPRPTAEKALGWRQAHPPSPGTAVVRPGEGLQPEAAGKSPNLEFVAVVHRSTPFSGVFTIVYR